MVSKKIKAIGKELDVSGKDIKKIKKVSFSRRILHWLIGLIIAAIAFVAGYFTGSGSCPSVGEGSVLPIGYPYAFVPILTARACKTKKSKIAVLLVSALVFFFALKATSIFGAAIKYNVYKRK